MSGFGFDLTPDGPGGQRKASGLDSVRRAGYKRTGEVGPVPVTYQQRAKLYESWLRDFAPMMTKVSGRTPTVMPNAVKVVDRRGFVDAMVSTMDHLATAAAGQSADAALSNPLMRHVTGVMIGEMSARVLGLYVPAWQAGDGNTALYMVDKNITQYARQMGVPEEAFAKSILFHEATHHWQFSEHPWLNTYMEEMTSKLNGALDFKALLQPGVIKAVIEGGISGLIPGMAQMQATMSVIEGYSDFVMETLGKQYIPDFDRIEEGMAMVQAANRGKQTTIQKLIGRLTGMDMKMRQYSEGKAFCKEVQRLAGLPLLNRMWESAENLPTPTELAHPDQWVSRISTGGMRRAA